MVSAWQAPQTWVMRPLMSLLVLEACGVWQERQACFSMSGRWTRPLSNIAVICVAWQPRQRSSPCCLGLSAVGEVGASWHCPHIAFATGACTVS